MENNFNQIDKIFWDLSKLAHDINDYRGHINECLKELEVIEQEVINMMEGIANG